MNWGRPLSSGFRSIWNAGFDLGGGAKAYSFGNFADTFGQYSFFFRSPNRGGVLTPVPNDPTDPSGGNFSWGDAFPLGFTPELQGFQSDWSSVTGVKGEFGAGINYDVSASFGRNKISYLLMGTLNPSWGPFSQRDFRPGDLQQYERNFNIDLSKELNDKANLAVGFQRRNETYTLFEGEYQSYAAGPWAGVGNLINPETGENYQTPAIGANGLAGTSKDDAGVFESRSYGLYADLEVDITEAFLVQLAYRFEDYEEFGSANNIKICLLYTSPSPRDRG